MNPIINQGDIIKVDFEPTVGHEPNKMRPALVVSVGYFNNVVSSLVVVCPITSTTSMHPLHVKLPNDIGVDGYVCVEQLRAIDLQSRRVKFLDISADVSTMESVLTAIGSIFDI